LLTDAEEILGWYTLLVQQISWGCKCYERNKRTL
jgi:hypothetical protein